MKYLLWLVPLFFLAGCTPTMVVNNQRYYVMTETEEKEMLELARAILVKSKQVTTPAEKMFFKSNEPVMKIEYTGDRTGVARVTWTTSNRIIAVIYKGEFLTPQMGWVIETQPLLPETLRFEPPRQANP